MLPGKVEPKPAELMAMKIGPFLLLTMPGEPMVEYGFRLEEAIADRAIPVIVGYANGNIGYIPTTDSFDVGGYEPNRSHLTEDAEEIILRELGKLADQVVGDVFESFSKHPEDIKSAKNRRNREQSAPNRPKIGLLRAVFDHIPRPGRHVNRRRSLVFLPGWGES